MVTYASVTGTITYPYIMSARQVQMITYCHFGNNVFSSSDYGFKVSAPAGNCFLPNRLFPQDGSVQVLPSGWYSVIDEYAKGSIIKASRGTLLFEPVKNDRNTSSVLTALRNGGFLDDATVTEMTNPRGLGIILAKNVRGIDATAHFTWAFVMHPDGKVFLSVLNSRPDDSAVFDQLLNSLEVTPASTQP